MSIQALYVQQVAAGETRACVLALDNVLDSGETISSIGTPTVTPTGPTIGNVAPSTAPLDPGIGRTIPTGQAIQFTFTGGTDGITYEVAFSATSDATPSQVINRSAIIEVV